MPKLIEYVEVTLNDQLGPIAVMHGVASQEGPRFISSTHHWLTDKSVWSILASEYFGLPLPNLAIAIRIAKVVSETEAKAGILLVSSDHGMLVTALQNPRPCSGIQQPPSLLYQHCSKIFQAILDAKEQE